MAGAYVQGWQNSGNNNDVTSHTVTVSGATAGTLLVGVWGTRAGEPTVVAATGWTKMEEYLEAAFGNEPSLSFFYRIASGDSNDDFAVTWTGNCQDPSGVVQEVSGLDSTPYDVSNIDITNQSSNTTTQNTGSATPSAAGSMAVAAVIGREERKWGFISIDSSYINLDQSTGTGVVNVGAMASLRLAGTSAQNPQFSTTDSGESAIGAIGIFLEPAVGGGDAFSEIMGVPWANIAEINGAAKANIAEVKGGSV